MKKALQFIISLLFLTGAYLEPASAITKTLNFDSIPPGTEISVPGFFPDVEFSNGTGKVLVGFGVPSAPPFSLVHSAKCDPFCASDPFRADFSPKVNFVSVLLGDNGGDIDNLFLKAFVLSSPAPLDTDMAISPSGSFDGFELSVSAPQIDYVLFGSTGDAPNSIVFDNFTYSTTHGSVPEPSTVLLFGTGLASLAAWRYKKSVLLKNK